MANDEPGNQTPGTPGLSETELREMKIDDLRERARAEGVSGASSLRKEELVDAVSALHREGRAGGSGDRSGSGTGNGSSEPTKQDLADEETGAPGDKGPDRGRIRTGPQSSKSLEYRFDFGERTDKLRHITWEDWFRTFDERRLNFIYQEERKDGRQSTFFRLENPEREDA